MHPHKTVFTTGEVARICSVAPRTVSKWFDAGHLRGYRIPGSKDRRIPVEHLIRFMRAHGMPLNGLDNGVTRILLIEADEFLCEAVRQALAESTAYEVATACSALEAGAVAQETKPHVVVVDITLPDVAPRAICRFFRSLPTVGPICLIALAASMTEAAGQALLQEGFDGYLGKPFDVRSLISLIEQKVLHNTTRMNA